MTVTPTIDEDEEGAFWMMTFEMEHEYGFFSFVVSEPFIADLEEWRDLVAGKSGISFYQGNGEGSIEVTETHFDFVATLDVESGPGGSVTCTNKFKKEVVCGPLTKAVDEAVMLGYFGDEEREKYLASHIKDADDE